MRRVFTSSSSLLECKIVLFGEVFEIHFYFYSHFRLRGLFLITVISTIALTHFPQLLTFDRFLSHWKSDISTAVNQVQTESGSLLSFYEFSPENAGG